MCKCKECRYIQLLLGIWCRPFSQHPLPPARHQPHSLTPYPQKSSKKKQEIWKKRSNSQQIKLYYCLGLCIQSPELRQVDLDLSHKRGSEKINRLRPRRKNKRKQVVSFSLDSETRIQHLER